MSVPARLYKYRSGSTQDITSVSGAKLWFSSPSRFNDPFDCAYDIVLPKLTRTDCVTLLSIASGGQLNAAKLARMPDAHLLQAIPAGLKSAVERGLSTVGGVCCFSETPTDLLMWGHYANGHQGFCLEFDTSKEAAFQKARKVEYRNDIPSLGIETFTQFDLEQAMKLLLTKAKCWQYEQEWRVLHNESDKSYGYERRSLTAIYFGAKMPEDQILLIASILARTDTQLYRMGVSKSSFELSPEKIEFTPIDYRTPPVNAGRQDSQVQAVSA
jgi:hypothetical protein